MSAMGKNNPNNAVKLLVHPFSEPKRKDIERIFILTDNRQLTILFNENLHRGVLITLECLSKASLSISTLNLKFSLKAIWTTGTGKFSDRLNHHLAIKIWNLP